MCTEPVMYLHQRQQKQSKRDSFVKKLLLLPQQAASYTYTHTTVMLDLFWQQFFSGIDDIVATKYEANTKRTYSCVTFVCVLDI